MYNQAVDLILFISDSSLPLLKFKNHSSHLVGNIRYRMFNGVSQNLYCISNFCRLNYFAQLCQCATMHIHFDTSSIELYTYNVNSTSFSWEYGFRYDKILQYLLDFIYLNACFVHFTLQDMTFSFSDHNGWLSSTVSSTYHYRQGHLSTCFSTFHLQSHSHYSLQSSSQQSKKNQLLYLCSPDKNKSQLLVL